MRSRTYYDHGYESGTRRADVRLQANASRVMRWESKAAFNVCSLQRLVGGTDLIASPILAP
jgi:hypothetical protein